MKLSKKIRATVVKNLIMGVFGDKIATFEKRAAEVILKHADVQFGPMLTWSKSLTDDQKALVRHHYSFAIYSKNSEGRDVLFQPLIELEVFEDESVTYGKKVLFSIGYVRSRSYHSDITRIKSDIGYPCSSDMIVVDHNCSIKVLREEKAKLQKTIRDTANQVYAALLTVHSKNKAVEMMPNLEQYFPKPEKVSHTVVPSELYDNINNLIKA